MAPCSFTGTLTALLALIVVVVQQTHGLAAGDRSITNLLVPNALKRLFDRSGEAAFQCNSPHVVGMATDVTVEAQLVLFKNGLQGTGDNKYNGEDCEILPFDNCDYKVKMMIDTDNVFSRWPATSNEFVTTMKLRSSREPIVLQPDKKSSNDEDYIFRACKFIKSLSVVAVRLLILDEDSNAPDEVINQFNCYWAPSRLANDEASAQWEEVNCCTALECDTARDAIHEARIRVRAYTGQECPESGVKP